MAEKTIPKKTIKSKKKELGQLATLTKGFIRENPVFVYLLGLCPALAVTRTLETGFGMGLLVIFVLVMSNIVVSLIRNFIPTEVKIPSYIVIISTFVTIVGLVTEAYLEALHASLGIFIPLIVVNCLILARAESFASKNKVFSSVVDGLGMGLGFTFALMLIGLTREFLATGAIAYGEYFPIGVKGSLINFDTYVFKMGVFDGPAGGFIVIGLWLAVFSAIQLHRQNKAEIAKQKMIEEKKRIALERKRMKESAGEQA